MKLILHTGEVVHKDIGSYMHGLRADRIEITLDELLVYLVQHGEGRLREYFYQRVLKHTTPIGKVVLK